MSTTLGAPVALFTVSVMFAACVVVLNILTITAIVRTRSVRVSHSNMFILNFALLDILMMGPELAYAAMNFRGYVSPMTFVVSGICFSILAVAALLNNFAIAVDRFLFIQKAMTYPVIVTSARVKVTVLLIWVLAVLIGTIPLYDGHLFDVIQGRHHSDHIECDPRTHLHTGALNVSSLSPSPSPSSSPSSSSSSLLSSTNNASESVHAIENLFDERDPAVLIHQIASCPQLASTATRVISLLVSTIFVIMGVVTVGLYAKMFQVIRQHNNTLAKHASAAWKVPPSGESGTASDKEASTLDSISEDCRFRNLFGKGSSKLLCSEKCGPGEGEGGEGEKRPGKFRPGSVFGFLRRDLKKDGGSTKDSTPSRNGLPTPAGSVYSTQTPPSTVSSGSSLRAVLSDMAKDEGSALGKEYHQKTAPVGGQESITAVKESPATVAKPWLTADRKCSRRTRLYNHIRDIRTIKTLTAMFVIFYICWAPMHICKFILYGLQQPISDQVLLSAWILGVSNSIWNFLVYPMRKRELRASIKRLVCSWIPKRGNP